MNCWPGVRLSDELRADRLLLHAGDELLHDADVDVGLEQRETDLARDRVDVGLAQPAPAADPVEDAFETVGERVEQA